MFGRNDVLTSVKTEPVFGDHFRTVSRPSEPVMVWIYTSGTKKDKGKSGLDIEAASLTSASMVSLSGLEKSGQAREFYGSLPGSVVTKKERW